MSIVEERHTISICANALIPVAPIIGSLNTNVALYNKPSFVPDEVILKYVLINSITNTLDTYQLVSSDLPDLILFGFPGDTLGSYVLSPNIHFKWGKPVSGTFNLQIQRATPATNTAQTGPAPLATNYSGALFFILDFVKYNKSSLID